MSEITSTQTQQFYLLLKTLQKTANDIKSMTSEEISDKRIAGEDHRMVICAFILGCDRLRRTTQNRYDLPTGAILPNRKKYAEIKDVIRNNPQLQSLHSLGDLPWEMIQASFSSAGVECPFHFRIFHSVYQEIKNLPEVQRKLPDPGRVG